MAKRSMMREAWDEIETVVRHCLRDGGTVQITNGARLGSGSLPGMWCASYVVRIRGKCTLIMSFQNQKTALTWNPISGCYVPILQFAQGG
jgi:hypothetical protein